MIRHDIKINNKKNFRRCPSLISFAGCNWKHRNVFCLITAGNVSVRCRIKQFNNFFILTQSVMVWLGELLPTP